MIQYGQGQSDESVYYINTATVICDAAAKVYAFYAFYAWWIYFPQSGALAVPKVPVL